MVINLYGARVAGVISIPKQTAIMGVKNGQQSVEVIHGKLFNLSFQTFGRITVSLPLIGLLTCFVSAVIFNFTEVNKTVCNVQNVVPSISAITGVTPQRYIWRICIALHSTPRLAVGILYYNYYISRIHYVKESQVPLYKMLVVFNFVCYTIENLCLVGVTYIANVENYPVHEKIFVVFMLTSITYELMTIVLFRWAHPEMDTSHKIRKSYQLKKIFFFLILAFSAGLLYFFLRHRLYCEPNAQSFFSVFEYGIAVVNIWFHYTATYEFSDKTWVLGLSSRGSDGYYDKLDPATRVATDTYTATRVSSNHRVKKRH